MSRIALVGAVIVQPEGVIDDGALLIEGDRIVDIVPRGSRPASYVERTLEGGWLLPGFIDTQVNGGGDILLNDRPDVEGLRAIATAHRRFGTTGLLPTLISDDAAIVDAVIAAGEAALAQAMPGLLGVHIEGPHLNPAKKGIHDAAKFRAIDAQVLERLTQPTRGRRIVTLAPELAPAGAIRALSQAGVIVAAGHSLADYDQTVMALAEGLAGFTHLFNAMSQASARSPGLVGAALDHPDIAPGLIADGIHVHAAMIRAALAANRGRHDVFLVTDAMAPAGSDITRFTLNDREILRRDGRLTLADGTLAGADLTMPQAIRFMVDHVGEPLEKALARATTIPAGLLPQAPDLTHVDAMIWLDDKLDRPRWLDEL